MVGGYFEPAITCGIDTFIEGLQPLGEATRSSSPQYQPPTANVVNDGCRHGAPERGIHGVHSQ